MRLIIQYMQLSVQLYCQNAESGFCACMPLTSFMQLSSMQLSDTICNGFWMEQKC